MNGCKLPVILIDDEPHIRTAATQTLQLAGYNVTALATADKALEMISPDWPGVVVSDINMPGLSGIDFLHQALDKVPELPVILITGHGDISMAVNAIRDGAYDFIEKPFSSELLTDVVKRALEKRSLVLENRSLRQALEVHSAPGPRLIGRSPAIVQMRSLLHQVADTPADILLHGETGTGKDLAARFIHENSQRAAHNFVAINCGAVPEHLIESELFGHEQGAFTDAKQKRIGKLEHAHQGTLFLDEIESMPVSLQIKLLRVLEERSIERLGSNDTIDLDLRIIAATKLDLLELSSQGEFREDLYYRLNVVAVDIPPLRQRIEDVPLLFQHFALVASALYQKEIPALSPAQVESLCSYDWPGNVRELRNIAERYVLLGASGSFQLDQFDNQTDNILEISLPEKVERFEKLIIEETLAKHNGSIKQTMQSLGLPRKTLYDKMQKYALDKGDYKP